MSDDNGGFRYAKIYKKARMIVSDLVSDQQFSHEDIVRVIAQIPTVYDREIETLGDLRRQQQQEKAV